MVIMGIGREDREVEDSNIIDIKDAKGRYTGYVIVKEDGVKRLGVRVEENMVDIGYKHKIIGEHQVGKYKCFVVNYARYEGMCLIVIKGREVYPRESTGKCIKFNRYEVQEGNYIEIESLDGKKLRYEEEDIDKLK